MKQQHILSMVIISCLGLTGLNAQTVTDIDGNIYNTVTLGTQTWTTENLNTTKYNDGNAIPNEASDSVWKTLTTGAYCDYNNVPGSNGKLYNWYAINTGKLCPSDWHVPTDEEWTALENYLIAHGYNYDGTTNGNRESNNKIAKSLADTISWILTSTIGTVGNTDYPDKRNATGFKALAGGYRDFYGMFSWAGYDGCWWSSSEIVPGATTVWSRWINAAYANVINGHYDKYYGFSVRCVQDTVDNIPTDAKSTTPDVDSFYPNPANDKLYFNNINIAESQIAIFDLRGKQVLSKRMDKNTFDISNLSSGIYLLMISDSNNRAIYKLIKE